MERPTKRLKLLHESNSSLRSITPASAVPVYIIQAKLSPETIRELYALVNNSPSPQLRLSPDAAQAQVIITAIQMRQRLERNLDGALVEDKAIVTPDWLRDSVKRGTFLPCGDYAAVRDLAQTTAENCPEEQECEMPPPQSTPPSDLVQPSYTSNYACSLPCPLVCPNQDLVELFGVIRRGRELDSNEASALSYERTIAVIKAYPYRITRERLPEVAELPWIGEKKVFKIKEYLRTGTIQESQVISNNPRFQALCAFSAVWGIGTKTAVKLYDTNGLRTLEDLDTHFSVNALPYRIDSDSKINAKAPRLAIRDALALRAELNERIPRSEVEQMYAVVMDQLGRILPDCRAAIVGGTQSPSACGRYRRGKPYSNDVDIVITHPSLNSADYVSGLCETLVNRLHERGIITHVMHLGSFQPADAFRHTSWDTLEKALTVFRLPADPKNSPGTRRIHRRLDIIVTAPDTYWTAIVGWTGSKMFGRDIRRWAKERGLNFDSTGITRRRDGKLFPARSEEEVFFDPRTWVLGSDDAERRCIRAEGYICV
ncbi:DNA polymerase [Mycena kentingensis (nom. inval.)]|nr:DNA polymerase [Mycena kentingensis (nom. inval.)]